MRRREVHGVCVFIVVFSSSRRRHTRFDCDWSSDVCSSDLNLMNENFVNIKVDREERPDLDQIYMNAVQMMTGHGGWPMTMFLTPEGVPFYGGTYFPPEDRYNMAGFPRVLISVAEAYRSQPDQVAHTSTTMLGELRRVGLAEPSREMLSSELLDASYRRVTANYDRKNGGFGSAPKFPPAMTLEFLMR